MEKNMVYWKQLKIQEIWEVMKPVMEEKQRVFRFLGVTGRDMRAIEIRNFLLAMILQQ